jgi:hypothetical protein
MWTLLILILSINQPYIIRGYETQARCEQARVFAMDYAQKHNQEITSKCVKTDG